MDTARATVCTTVILILLTTLISGPLVGTVDFTTEHERTFAPGTGQADITVMAVPERARLEQGRYGSGAYYLRIPDATVQIDAIEGQPMLVYKIRLPELGITHATTHFLDETIDGEMALSIRETTFDPDEINQEIYPGELIILVRTDNSDVVLYRGNVTVDVIEREPE